MTKYYRKKIRNEYKKVRYLLYLSIKMKINPISFCFLPVSLYLCAWIRQKPLPDIFVKTKHWLLLWSSGKSVGNFLSEYTTAPIMVGFICGKHRWASRQICRVDVHARYRVWAFLYLTVVQTFLRLPRKTLRIVHTLLLCLLVSSLMIVGCSY